MPFAQAVRQEQRAFKKNGFYEVRAESEPTDLFLASGYEEVGDNFLSLFMGDRKFKERGELTSAILQGHGPVVLTGPQYVGNAHALYVAIGTNYARFAATKNGRVFDTLFDLTYWPNYLSWPAFAYVGNGSIYQKDDGKKGWVFGVSFMDIDNPTNATAADGNPAGAWNPMFLVYEDGDLIVSEGMVVEGGVRHGVPSVGRAGPKTLVACTPVYPVLVTDVATLPPPFLSVSKDNGHTWSKASADAFSEWFLDRDVATTPEYNSQVHSLVLTFSVVPLNASECIVFARSGTRTGKDEQYLAAALNLDTLTISTPWEVNVPLGVSGAALTVARYLFSRDQHVLMCVDAHDLEAPPVLLTGVSFASWSVRVLPYATPYCGALVPLTPKSFGLPVYNLGEERYELHMTKDLGATWERRAVMSDTAKPPTGFEVGMLSFGTVCLMRSQDEPANAFPDVPWVGDFRIDPP